MAGQCFESQQAGDRLCRNFGCSSQPGGSAGWSLKGTWSGLWWFLSNAAKFEENSRWQCSITTRGSITLWSNTGTDKHLQRVPWLWASFSSLNWVTCCWSLDSFGLWQPYLDPKDNGDWQELLDEGTLGSQEEEGVDPDLILIISSEVSKYDGNIAEGSGPRLDAGVEM